MNKNLIVALVLIGLTVIVLLITKGDAKVNILFTVIQGAASFVYLSFIALGVVIGMLLK